MRADLLDLVEEVRGEEDRGAVRGQLPHQGPDLAHALRVEAVGRLVQHEQLARPQQRRGQAEALLHAERVGTGLLARGAREAHPIQGALDAGGPGAGVGGGVGGVEPHEIVAAAEEAVEGGPLDQGAHPRQHPPPGAGHRLAQHPGGARRRFDQPHQHPDGGGLAGAVGPEEAEDTAPRHDEVEPVDGELPTAVALGEAERGDHRFHRLPRPCSSRSYLAASAALTSASLETAPT
ncbi:hypothetical protein GCM10020000_44460 [Streptomyces olivoverticillatus]